MATLVQGTKISELASAGWTVVGPEVDGMCGGGTIMEKDGKRVIVEASGNVKPDCEIELIVSKIEPPPQEM